MDYTKFFPLLPPILGVFTYLLTRKSLSDTRADKLLDRLKQIGDEVRKKDPDQWWAEQAFERVFGLFLKFDLIKVLVESKVRTDSVMRYANIVRRHIVFEPHSLERKFANKSWQTPRGAARGLVGWWVIFALAFSGSVFLILNYSHSWWASLFGMSLESLSMYFLVQALDSYIRISIVYPFKDFGRFHDFFLKGYVRRSLALKI